MNLMATCLPVVLSSARTTKPNVPLLRLRTCGGVHAGWCPDSTRWNSCRAYFLILGVIGKRLEPVRVHLCLSNFAMRMMHS